MKRVLWQIPKLIGAILGVIVSEDGNSLFILTKYQNPKTNIRQRCMVMCAHKGVTR